MYALIQRYRSNTKAIGTTTTGYYCIKLYSVQAKLTTSLSKTGEWIAGLLTASILSFSLMNAATIISSDLTTVEKVAESLVNPGLPGVTFDLCVLLIWVRVNCGVAFQYIF